MKIEVSKDDLKLILQNTLDRVHTCDEFKRLEKAAEGPKIHIHGRRWFQKTYGNTYHQVKIYLNDELAAFIPEQYGYGEQYLQTAWEWLVKKGLVEDIRYQGTIGYGERGITYMCGDVELRRNLWKS